MGKTTKEDIVGESTNEEEEPKVESISKKKNVKIARNRKSEGIKKRKLDCKKCGKSIELCDEEDVMIHHAVAHTTLYRYSCRIADCNYKSYRLHSATSHMKIQHNMTKPTWKDVRYRKMPSKEKSELEKMVDECFPGASGPALKSIPTSSEPIVFDCQKCEDAVSETTEKSTVGRRAHIYVHLDIMFYKCTEPTCHFETKKYQLMLSHQSDHGLAPETVENTRIELTDEQNALVESTLIECFPEVKEQQVETVEEGDTEDRADKDQERKQSCAVCQRAIDAKDLASKWYRRAHALTHTDIMIYQCCKEDCDYEAACFYKISKHRQTEHQMVEGPVTMIELTFEQEIEIQEMMNQCFPEWNDE